MSGPPPLLRNSNARDYCSSRMEITANTGHDRTSLSCLMVETPAIGDFAMYGARSAVAGGLSHIDEQVKSIERAVTENPGLAFDLARTVIESTCKAILSERNVPFASADDLPKLFRIATSSLPFLPASASAESEIRRSLAQTLNGLHTAVWAPTDFFCIDTTFYVVPKDECAGLHFLYYSLARHDLPSLGADSAVPGLNRNLVYMK